MAESGLEFSTLESLPLRYYNYRYLPSHLTHCTLNMNMVHLYRVSSCLLEYLLILHKPVLLIPSSTHACLGVPLFGTRPHEVDWQGNEPASLILKMKVPQCKEALSLEAASEVSLDHLLVHKKA